MDPELDFFLAFVQLLVEFANEFFILFSELVESTTIANVFLVLPEHLYFSLDALFIGLEMSDLVLCFTQLFLLGAQSLIVRLTPVLHISLHFLPMLGTCLCFRGLKLSILERFLELLDLRLERCELINLLLDRVFVLLSLCEKLGACLMHLVKFFLCVAHLLDDTLHLTGVS